MTNTSPRYQICVETDDATLHEGTPCGNNLMIATSVARRLATKSPAFDAVRYIVWDTKADLAKFEARVPGRKVA